MIRRFTSIGLAAVLGLGVLTLPTYASAQYYRHPTRNENRSRNAALALGAAGLILLNQHQNTLGTVALGAAAYEGLRMQHDIQVRHRQYGYGYNSRYAYYNPYYGYRNRYGDGDGDEGWRGRGHYRHDRGHHYGWRNGRGHHGHDEDDD